MTKAQASGSFIATEMWEAYFHLRGEQETQPGTSGSSSEPTCRTSCTPVFKNKAGRLPAPLPLWVKSAALSKHGRPSTSAVPRKRPTYCAATK
jgi:hypothetical protein